MLNLNHANAVGRWDTSAEERIAEIGQILAQGLVRLQGRKSSELPRPNGESSLDFTAHQSGHDKSLHNARSTP